MLPIWGYYELMLLRTTASNSLDRCCLFFLSFLFCLFLPFLGLLPTAYGGSQARGRIGATVAGLCHSCSNTKSEPHLPPTPQHRAMLDP